jgi:hypothetical protein
MEGGVAGAAKVNPGVPGGGSPPQGWASPRPDRVPRNTYAPAAAALGVTFIFWGLVTTVAISVVGIVLFGLSLADWIREARDELER